jgi:hypothetical protein
MPGRVLARVTWHPSKQSGGRKPAVFRLRRDRASFAAAGKEPNNLRELFLTYTLRESKPFSTIIDSNRGAAMYLEKISVRNYRSISTLVMAPCRDFNVLIGRNNSGKSNILTSIEAFFSAAVTDIFSLAPALGNEIDFHQKDVAHPLILNPSFDFPKKSGMSSCWKYLRSDRKFATWLMMLVLTFAFQC